MNFRRIYPILHQPAECFRWFLFRWFVYVTPRYVTHLFLGNPPPQYPLIWTENPCSSLCFLMSMGNQNKFLGTWNRSLLPPQPPRNPCCWWQVRGEKLHWFVTDALSINITLWRRDDELWVYSLDFFTISFYVAWRQSYQALSVASEKRGTTRWSHEPRMHCGLPRIHWISSYSALYLGSISRTIFPL